MAVDSAINNVYFIVFYKTESFTALAIKPDSKRTDKYVKILLTYILSLNLFSTNANTDAFLRC